MITDKIKKYDEPVYSHTSYAPTITQELVDSAIKEAEEKIKLGDKFEYTSGTGILEFVGYDNNPKTVTLYQGKPAVIWLQRLDNGTKFHYSLQELFSAYMRQVPADEDPTLTIPGC